MNETEWKALQCVRAGAGRVRAIWYGVLNQTNANYPDTQVLIQPQMPQLKYESRMLRYDDDDDDNDLYIIGAVCVCNLVTKQ